MGESFFAIDADAIDWAMLSNQKEALLDAAKASMSEDEIEAFEGLLGLIDHIQDVAAVRLGADVVYGEN